MAECTDLNLHGLESQDMLGKMNIRVAEISDAEELLKIYAPYVENTAITFEYDVPSIEEFAIRITNTLKKYPYFVAEIEGEIVGYTYASSFHSRPAYQWCVETSIYVKSDMRGKGIGKLLYLKLEEALKKMGVLNLNACIGYPQVDDEYLTKNSEKFHQHMGYTKVAESHMCGYKFNRWYNIIWMEKMIGEHVINPVPVRSFSDEL